MSVTSLVPCVVVLYLNVWGAHTLSPKPACPTPCLCQRSPLLNCSSSGLSKAPSHFPATATALDLSHNDLKSLVPLWSGRLRLRGLRHFWVGDNALESLSLCLEKGVEGTKTLTGRKERCMTWAPDLKLLSAERNQLKQIPRGLCNVKALQVLNLSHNKISELGPADLAECTHLQEVHLQNNLIDNIHPEAFKDLFNLQVLDLSYNLLTIIPLPAYLSLRNTNTLVSISGNQWRCDCNLKPMRRWLSFDNEQSNSEWKVVCYSPAHNAGKDLLQLEESDLNCSSPAYSTATVPKKLTVDEGTELLLSCAMVNQDSSDFMQSRWWTPQGQVSENQQVFFISNITEQHAGLYVCVSGFQEEHVSAFNIDVRKRVHNTRLRREVQKVSGELTAEENNMNMQRNGQSPVSHSDFVLAVCLSVIITFIVAFVLGVLLRPFLDKLCKRIKTKKNPTSTTSRSSTLQPHPYVNEGYSETDEHMQEVRVGSRVTFGGVTEVRDCGGSIPYYVTVEDDKSDRSSENNADADISYDDTQESESFANSVEIHCVEMEEISCKQSSNPSNVPQVSKEVPLREADTSDPKSTSGYSNAETTKGMAFEPILDPGDSPELEARRASPVSFSGLPQELESSSEVQESMEQSVDSPTFATHEDEESNISKEIPRFTTDPLSGKEENVDDLDPDLWNDSGDSFSFTDDSLRSSSRVTQVAVLDYPLYENEMSVDTQSDKLSSCESGLTEEEQTEYTVNPEENEELEICDDALFTPEPDACFRQNTITPEPSDVQMTFTQKDSFDNGPFTVQNAFSDDFHFVEEEPRQYHVHPVYRTGRNITVPLETDKSGTCSSSDEDEAAENADFPRRLHITEPEINTECFIPVKNPNSILHINFDNSSSSTDMEEKATKDRGTNSFKSVSGQSIPLINQSGTEADMNPPPTTTDRDRGKTGEETSEESFFGTIGQAFNRLPKLKRSLLFSVSDPQPPIQYGSTPTAEVGCDSKTSHLNLSPEENSFGKIDLNLDPAPKVKRYIKFSQSGTPTTSLKTQTGSGIYDTSEDEWSPAHTGDSFFEQVGTSFVEVPKLKRYIQFTQSEPQTSPQSTSTPWVTPKLETTVQSSISEGEVNPFARGENFFGGIRTSLDGVPKVKRYIQFTKSEPQLSGLLPLSTKTVTPEFKTVMQSGALDSSSKDEPSLSTMTFFGQTDASLNGVPKVKRSLQFRKSEPQHLAQTLSTSLKTEGIIPVFGTKTQPISSDSSFEDELHPTSKGDCFFEQISTPVDGVPKVKRYIQFTPSERPLITKNTENVTPELETDTHIKKPSFQVEFMSTSVVDSFIGQICPSVDKVPKVKRYIHFTRPVPQPSAHSISTALKTERLIPVCDTKTSPMKSDFPSSDEPSPTSEGVNIFGPIRQSFHGVSKVKRYIQFSQSEPQPSGLFQSCIKTERVTPEFGTKTSTSSSEGELSPTSEGDGFFLKTGTAIDGVPKVKRYIQFKQSEPQFTTEWPLAPLQTESVTPALLSKIQSIKSENEQIPTSKGDSFFEQINTTLAGVPKVKRYIQFTISEPQLSLATTSLRTESEFMRSDSSSKDDLSTTSGFFGQIRTSLDFLPKVKRYIHFKHSEPQHSHNWPLAPLSKESITPSLVSKRSDSVSDNECSSTSKGDFFQQVNTLERVPKVIKYIQFTQSEPPFSAQTTPLSLKKECVTPTLVTTIPPGRYDSTFEDELSSNTKDETFVGYVGTSLDGVPKVKRYVHFTQSEPSLSSESPTFSNTERVAPMLMTKLQSGRPSLKTKGDFFEKVGTSFVEVPKLKRYIQFTQSGPQSPPRATSTPWVTPKLETTVQSDSISEGEINPLTSGENFFGGIRTSLDGVPKVKRYIQFTKSEPQLSGLLPLSTKTPEFKTEMQSGALDSSSNDEPSLSTMTFFGQTDASLNGVPKVKRSLQFTKSEPQSSSQLLVTKIQPETFDLLSGDKLSSASKGDYFFEQARTSLDGVPKVKRYIEFTQSEPLTQTRFQYAPSIETEPIIHAAIEAKLSSNKDNFFEGMHLSFEKVTKVKRYLQFTQPVPKLADQLVSPSLNKMTKRELNSPTYSPEKDAKANQDCLFGQLDTSLDGVLKVKRYIQFSQTEFYRPTPTVNAEGTRKAKDSGEDFFEYVDSSVDQVPKLKRYVKFTHPHIPAESTSLSTEMETLSASPPEEEFSSSSNGGSFLPIGASFDGVPKVKRYIQFAQPKPQPPSPFTSSDNTTDTESKPPSLAYQKENGDNFFIQISVAFDQLPKVKQYVHFTQAETYASSQTPSHLLNPLGVVPVLTTKAEREHSLSSEYSLQCSTESDASMLPDGVPKVTRYITFGSKPHSQTQIPEGRRESDSDVNVTVDDDENFFGQRGRSFDALHRPEMSDPVDKNQIKSISSIRHSSFPVKAASEKRSELLSRPKRTLFFSNSDPYGQSDQPLTSSRPELSTQEFETVSDLRLSSLRGFQTITVGSQPSSTPISESIPDTGLRSLRTDVPLQDIRIKETSPISPEKDEVREYLRDSSQARQRQERRKLLFEQKRRAMDRFSLTSYSTASQESEKQGLSDDYGDTVPPVSTHSASPKDVDFSGSEDLTSKRMSSLKYKSALHYGTYKHRSDV